MSKPLDKMTDTQMAKSVNLENNSYSKLPVKRLKFESLNGQKVAKASLEL